MKSVTSAFGKIAKAINNFIGFIGSDLTPEVVKTFDTLFDTDKRVEYNVIGDKHGQKQTSGINDSGAKLSENIRRGEAEQLENLSPEDKKLGNRVPGRRSTLQQEQSTVFHRRVLPDNSRQLTLHNGNTTNVVAEFFPNQKYSEIIQRKGKTTFIFAPFFASSVTERSAVSKLSHFLVQKYDIV